MRATHRDDVDGSPASGGQVSEAAVVSPNTGRRGLRYVAGLDGIRALAVVGVLLFHADVSWMQGGFLGVDVFFVLSGFLITSLLLTEIRSTGRLRFGAFYLRRARRLLPALFLTLIGSLGLAWLFARDAFHQVLRDIPYALTYVINWAYTFRHQSYFEAIGRPPLLQHLWSLAIEEQFYLIWPSVVALIAILFRKRLRTAVFVVATLGALLSTFLMAWVANRNGYPDLADPSPIYFATHTHAMGILTGAAVAALFVGRFESGTVRRRWSVLGSVASLIGVVGIVATYVVVSEYSNRLYRGGILVFAIVCVLAVVGVAVPGSWGNTVLGTQPLRYLGQRSYGLYLYHWPIFMVLRPGQDVALAGWPNTLLRLALTLVVADLSYRFVEMPVRRGALGTWFGFGSDPAGKTTQHKPPRNPWRRTAIAALATTCVVLVVALAAQHHDSTVAAPVAPAHPHPVVTLGPTIPPAIPVKPAPRPQVAAPIVHTTAMFVGDSVMLGASGGLRREFPRMRLDAAVGRQPRAYPKIIKQLKDAGRIPQLVIIHMGTNGYVSAPILRHVLTQLQSVRTVILVTVHVPRPWTRGSNIMITKLAEHFANVRIADWAALSAGQNSWFVSDGVHLTELGVRAYSALIARTALA